MLRAAPLHIAAPVHKPRDPTHTAHDACNHTRHPTMCRLLPRRGELYFELHRGTYTSHAANKADNRACELLLREAEAAGAMAAALLHPGSYCYPK